MLTVTSRLAIKINHHMDGELSSDSQKSRSCLSLNDILPGPKDGNRFMEMAILTVMEVLLSAWQI